MKQKHQTTDEDLLPPHTSAYECPHTQKLTLRVFLICCCTPQPNRVAELGLEDLFVTQIEGDNDPFLLLPLLPPCSTVTHALHGVLDGRGR